MVNTIKRLIAVSMVAVFGLAYATAVPATVMAQNPSGAAKDDVCAGITSTGGSCDDRGQGLTRVIKLIVQIISVIAGVVAVIMIIVGGLRYITSGGDSSKVAAAKSAIIYAIVGLVIVALAQVIVRYVADATTTG